MRFGTYGPILRAGQQNYINTCIRIKIAGVFRVKCTQRERGAKSTSHLDSFVEETVHHAHQVMERQPLEDPPDPVLVDGLGARCCSAAGCAPRDLSKTTTKQFY